MKQRLRTKPAGLLLPVFLLIAAKLLSAHPAVKYQALLEFIEKTRFIDVHAHPSLAHLDYKKEFKDLPSYLNFVGEVLADWKKQGAVAFKVSSAYIIPA